MCRHFAILAIFVFAIFSTNLHAQNTAKKQSLELKSLPNWIWLSDAGSDRIAIRHEFEIKGEVKQALLAATAVYTADAEAKPVTLKKEDVEQVTPSKISQMPTGLIDALNDDELRHLLAYIMAAGDNRAKVYK